MLRIHQSGSVVAAKHYFTEGLAKGDYYVGVEMPGYWHGRGAEMLGLTGEIEKADFHALCENRDPANGNQLTARNAENRRVGYDITFNCPKSVSIMHGVIGDGRIMEVFRASVRETMALIEQEAHVRIRSGGRNADRRSGNLIWGEFVHLKSRPVDGVPDPALHCHAYVFNASHDPVEQKWKAGQFFYIKHDAPYYEAIFHSKLAMGLRELGYGIINQPFGFEIEGISRANIEKFSRRTLEIEALADELGIQGNDLAKSKLAALTRKEKNVGLTAKQIRDDWLSRIDRKSLAYDCPIHRNQINVQDAADLAIEQAFERRSIIQKRRLIALALQLSLGSCSPEEIEKEINNKEELMTKKIGDFDYVTTKEVIAEEKEIREFLQRTKNSRSALALAVRDVAVGLDEGQLHAMQTILSSRDRVVVVEGRAGTGKTTMMKATVAAIKSAGTQVATFAPTAEAAHEVLRNEGFENSETIQRLLVDRELQSQIWQKVIWIDEAGLLSSKEMGSLIRIADEQNSRLVLSGDTKQHHSVDRGDALRLVAASGLVRVASTIRVFRQRRADYRENVKLLAEGKVNRALAGFELMGAFKEIPELEERLHRVADDYLESIKRYGSVLLVSPTRLEGKLITAILRSKLREKGHLGRDEVRRDIHVNKNLTLAERKQSMNYAVSDVVRFHGNFRKYRKGDSFVVARITNDGCVVVTKGDDRDILNLEAAEKFQVNRIASIALSVGEKIRITENTHSVSGKRLFNCSVHEIAQFEEGQIILKSGEKLPLGFCGFDYGYVSTSHASQGKTCGKVIICQSSVSHSAASLEQFYVSASRGRDDIAIYTDDREHLQRTIRESAKRMLATEAFPELRSRRSVFEKLRATIKKQAERIAGTMRRPRRTPDQHIEISAQLERSR